VQRRGATQHLTCQRKRTEEVVEQGRPANLVCMPDGSCNHRPWGCPSCEITCRWSAELWIAAMREAGGAPGPRGAEAESECEEKRRRRYWERRVQEVVAPQRRLRCRDNVHARVRRRSCLC
jgi:hypothetical protein